MGDETRGSKQGWDQGKVSEALGLYAQLKEAPKDSVNRINEILMQYLKKSKLMQKIHDELFMKILNKVRAIREVLKKVL